MEIKFKDVTYIYKSKKLLDKINITIESNKITGITGESKTVLCNILNGTKNIEAGEVIIGDIPGIKENIKYVRRTVSMIRQNYQVSSLLIM